MIPEQACMRPRFERVVPLAPERVIETIRRRLEEPDCPCRGQINGLHAELTMPPRLRHLWSPGLSVRVEAHEEQALVRCRFGPHPDVWTTFVLLYGIVLCAGLACTVFAISQWSLGQSPSALWGSAGAALLGALLYLVAFIGRGLGCEEMYLLRAFLDHALDRSPLPAWTRRDGAL